MGRKKKSGDRSKKLFRDSASPDLFEKSIEEEIEAERNKPVECLGMTFENDQARREHFLGKLREGLEELEEKLDGVEFTTVQDAVERMKSLEKWPMAPRRSHLTSEASAKEVGEGGPDEERLRELAERMRHTERGKDLLQRWKDEVGFPHGNIEDILNLSDPPYYTACPNPFLGDFVKHYGTRYDPATDDYRREPFAADVSEGKNDPIYNAHSYHTKVPHKAIMRYVLHYTEPGDVVFDGFCGTGMTGVATQLCGDKATVESLGYQVDGEGVVYQQGTDESGKTGWKPFSKLGARRAVLKDLCPAATFIAFNYNTPVDVKGFEREAKRILKEVEEECGWMYETSHGNGETKGHIEYTVWSDLFNCPECGAEAVFWEIAVDPSTGYRKAKSESLRCPSCGMLARLDEFERTSETVYDPVLNSAVNRLKRIPVLIEYSVDGQRFTKEPDESDLSLMNRIEQTECECWFPTYEMMFKGNQNWGDSWRSGYHFGITHAHHFYIRRSLTAWACLMHKVRRAADSVRPRLLFWAQSVALGQTLLNRYLSASYSQVNRYLKGTMYIAPFISEVCPSYALSGKVRRLAATSLRTGPSHATGTGTASGVFLDECSADYVFVDPPFGSNLNYSELNFIWECWLKVFTNNVEEGVVSPFQGKGRPEYQHLMERCFAEYVRILKPGRWMTIEFHNSKNAVWNAIQEAILRAGFVIADVRVLDKKQMTMQQMTSAGAVKQDLVISAYKPPSALMNRFKLEAGTEKGAWDFVRMHMRQLPVVVEEDGQVEVIVERQNYLLFDRMVAFHVQRGVTVPLSAAEFYQGLAQRFPERDGMYFLPEQVAEYDRKRMKAKKLVQLPLIVTDEASAIQWLRQQLREKPQTFQEMSPQFMREVGGWEKHEKPLELSEMLAQNFIRYDGEGEVPSQIHSYLSSNFHELRSLEKDDPKLCAKAKDRFYVPDPNKAGDLEKLRERALLREFWEYLPTGYEPTVQKGPEGQVDLPGMGKREKPIPKGKRMKVIRLEAVRAGFKRCWQNRDYRTIIAVAQRIPEDVLQEDPKLLMWYDQAITRTGAD